MKILAAANRDILQPENRDILRSPWRPGDLEKIRHAGLLVRVGLGYDYWLDKLVRQSGDKRLMRGGELCKC